jgi:YhcH/YjgK/YiaL family protein
MILDTIKNISLYSNINPYFDTALNYLKDTVFSNMEPGRSSVLDNKIISILNIYETKNLEDCRLEAHRRNIDVHFVVEGIESIAYALYKNQEQVTEYDLENDFALYCSEKNYLTLSPGMFAVFFPSDLHMPGIMINEPAPVKKVVLKIKT